MKSRHVSGPSRQRSSGKQGGIAWAVGLEVRHHSCARRLSRPVRGRPHRVGTWPALRIVVEDLGDDIYDAVVLVDDITVSAVPH